jgi:hypothetical protein
MAEAKEPDDVAADVSTTLPGDWLEVVRAEFRRKGVDLEVDRPARQVYEQAACRLNRWKKEYLYLMLHAVELARREADSFTLARALNECARWMRDAGRLREALSFYRQRLEPAVWHEDKLEMRCIRDFVKEIEDELGIAPAPPTRKMQSEGLDHG